MPLPKRILAVASSGGHWVQLLRLRPAFEGCDVAYVTNVDAYRDEVPGCRFYTVPHASRWSKLGVCSQAWRMLRILVRERPDVIVSTGAAPGYVAIRLGRLLGCKSVWVDSIANVESLSMSGQLVKAYADLRLTQWPHLNDTEPGGPKFEGAVL